MIYRIDKQHFLTHAIDHFTRDELIHLKYAIISAAINNYGKATNVSKVNELYPTVEIIENYAEFKDKRIMEKMYMELLTPDKNERGINFATTTIYKCFINPLLKNDDVVIICDRNENDYIDVLCKFLKKHFELEVIDLNELFTKGKIGPIYIDRKSIKDKAVDIRLDSLDKKRRDLETTSDGRRKLLGMMNKKEKLRKLKEIGITVNDNDNLDELLIDAWVEDEED